MRAVLRKPAVFKGVGVHCGLPATAVAHPAPAGSGIVFRRVDLAAGRSEKNADIPARFDAVVDTRLCTVLANEDGVTVSTVEHLMAALAGLGIDDALIEIDGPETPIMDGSSAPFVNGLLQAGLGVAEGPRRMLEILKPVRVEKDGKLAELSPARQFQMSFEIDFAEAAIGRQTRSMTLINGSFVRELSEARTFGRLHEVEQLRQMGLARGGSLENTIVVDGDKVLNEGGLRYEDEFVRHKMLDVVGDLALAGGPIKGRYVGVKAGHEMTNLLLRKLFDTADAWRWSTAGGERGRSLETLGAGLAAA